MVDTQEVVVPLLSSISGDGESVIRQHLAAQLLSVSAVCMILPTNNNSQKTSKTKSKVKDAHGLLKVQEWLDHPEWQREYDPKGYAIVTQIVIGQILSKLISDVDVDVRRAAADALTGLALQIKPEDIGKLILPIPLQLAADNMNTSAAPNSKKTEAEQQAEEWRMTATNLLAELGGAVAEHTYVQAQAIEWATEQLLPAVLECSTDASFRVRRAAAQALPRILGACSVETVTNQILPAFQLLSNDDLYRVRKSTGECLVDMSRSLVILASHQDERSYQKRLLEARRSILIPIADRLIQDEHKLVRQGMMQFLGPFMASFYPFQNSPLDALLPATSESDGSNHMGIVAQFFPHATSMVSRLNSSQNAVTNAPTPVLIDPVLEDTRLEIEKLQQALPMFIQASRRSAHSLHSVQQHRDDQPPPHKDLEAIVNELLDYFAALAIVQTGDENTDAEMRVYCAYSFPAIVLLLGPENWPGALKTCFFTLLNPSYADEEEDDDDGGITRDDKKDTEPPLPVKRCLASSLHTVAHILGPDISSSDILPVFCDYFLRDADEAVRLNVIRGFPAFLAILPEDQRTGVFLQWSEVMHGEDCLGAKKRSATNPMVLNWRQRDYLARSLPDLVGLLPPDLIHVHVWPIVMQLLSDSVNMVRDDALWTVALLFKSYTSETAAKWPSSKRFNTKMAVMQIVTWFKDNVLKASMNGTSNGNSSLEKSSSAVSDKSGSHVANFADRQLYCRLCGTVALALRLNDEIRSSGKKDLAAALGESFSLLFFGGSNSASKDESALNMPFQKLSSAESKHMKKILEDLLLPDALLMKDDLIRNVRVTLLKVLGILPLDMRESPQVKPVLQSLTEEVATWESFGDEAAFVTQQATQGDSKPPNSPAHEKRRTAPTPKKSSSKRRSRDGRKDRHSNSSSGPVDLDDMIDTVSSKDEEEKTEESRDESARTPRKPKKKGKGKREALPDAPLPDSGAEKKSGQKTSAKAVPISEGESIFTRAKMKMGGGDDEVVEIDDSDESDDQEDDPPIAEVVDEGAVERNIASKFEEQENQFQAKVNRDLEEVPDHENDEVENPDRVKIASAFKVKTLPDVKRDDKRRKVSRSSSKGSRGSKSSSRDPAEQRGRESAPKKTYVEKFSKKSAPVIVEDVAPAAGAEEFFNAESLAGWKTVVFEDGPIGLQLEPTANDAACRVYGFLESGNARKSGKIELGDVIVKVNEILVKSYDETVDLLKRGGRRSVTFRPGAITDDYMDEPTFSDEEGSGDLTGSEEESTGPKKKKKIKKKAPGKVVKKKKKRGE